MRKLLLFLLAVFVCAIQHSARAESINDSASITASSANAVNSSDTGVLSALQVSQRIAEAKALLRSRPVLTNLTSVTLAALDPLESQISLLSISKDDFLKRGSDVSAVTQLGRAVRLRVLRANGVNTAVTVTDSSTGRALIPLAVEYPIAKGKDLKEVALYTSAHPALISPQLVSEGQTYVTKMLEAAARDLAQNGLTIAPDLVNVAEHLCLVEHTDHKRFLNGDRSAIYPDILSLYALNQGDTFNYSVSTAGAGGMIQMIPRTYEAIRQHHPNIGLEADFVAGMRNHANALKAMLLYINDTWSYLKQSTDVQDALRSGTATKAELLAAGYNSNPFRLPQYLSKGGAAWRTLIPAETQMYLGIYQSVDTNVHFADLRAPNVETEALARSQFGTETSGEVESMLTSWVGKQLVTNAMTAVLSNFLR